MTYICYEDVPFRAKSLAIINQANEIISDYSAMGYTLTLRQLYYQFVSMDLIPNKEESYKNLGNTINNARLAGLISWNAIEDRGRGIQAWTINEDAQSVLDDIEYQFSRDLWATQDCYVECWIEKDALSSVLEKACSPYRVPYMPCKGYLSASEAWRAGRRFRRAARAGRRCVMIHLGDHDPSGLDMTRDNSRRLDLFSDDCGVEVRRIALNMDQIRKYDPPPNPAKLTDSRSSDYVMLHGDKSYELDALKPQIIEQLVTDEITSLIVDPDLWELTIRDEQRVRDDFVKLRENWDDVRAFLETLE